MDSSMKGPQQAPAEGFNNSDLGVSHLGHKDQDTAVATKRKGRRRINDGLPTRVGDTGKRSQTSGGHKAAALARATVMVYSLEHPPFAHRLFRLYQRRRVAPSEESDTLPGRTFPFQAPAISFFCDASLSGAEESRQYGPEEPRQHKDKHQKDHSRDSSFLAQSRPMAATKLQIGKHKVREADDKFKAISTLPESMAGEPDRAISDRQESIAIAYNEPIEGNKSSRTVSESVLGHLRDPSPAISNSKVCHGETGSMTQGELLSRKGVPLLPESTERSIHSPSSASQPYAGTEASTSSSSSNVRGSQSSVESETCLRNNLKRCSEAVQTSSALRAMDSASATLGKEMQPKKHRVKTKDSAHLDGQAEGSNPREYAVDQWRRKSGLERSKLGVIVKDRQAVGGGTKIPKTLSASSTNDKASDGLKKKVFNSQAVDTESPPQAKRCLSEQKTEKATSKAKSSRLAGPSKSFPTTADPLNYGAGYGGPLCFQNSSPVRYVPPFHSPFSSSHWDISNAIASVEELLKVGAAMQHQASPSALFMDMNLTIQTLTPDMAPIDFSSLTNSGKSQKRKGN